MRLRLTYRQAMIVEDLVLEELNAYLFGGAPVHGRFDEEKELKQLLADLRQGMKDEDDEAREGSRDE